MENKKYLPLKIVNFVLIAASLVFCFITLMNGTEDTSTFGNGSLMGICCFVNAFATIVLFFYMFLGYTKNAATYYKTFMALIVLDGVLIAAHLMNTVISPIWYAVLYLISLVANVILTFSKDLGKKNTYAAIAVFLLCRIGLLVADCFGVVTDGTQVLTVISMDVAFVLLALSAGFMAAGKYIDKASRGSK